MDQSHFSIPIIVTQTCISITIWSLFRHDGQMEAQLNTFCGLTLYLAPSQVEPSTPSCIQHYKLPKPIGFSLFPGGLFCLCVGCLGEGKTLACTSTFTYSSTSLGNIVYECGNSNSGEFRAFL
jgi:hypothetical protein